MGLFDKIFGTRSQREVKKLQPLVNKVLALESEYGALSEEALKGKTAIFKERLAKGETLDDILPEAFAAIREAAWRVLGMKPYPVQLIGGIVLHQGRIAEMRTGEGKTLTADLLCSEYRKLNEQYFGPDMVVDDEIAMEWARIPHFYYNYYVFQYATGYSAAIALSRKILAEGESAVKDYLNFLSGGCSKSPIDLLKGAGVDMTGPEPVNQALELFGKLLDEMEELTKDL